MARLRPAILVIRCNASIYYTLTSFQQRTLASAVAANDAHHLALFDFEADVF